MKYPKAVKILNNIFTIEWKQTKLDDHQLKHGDKIFGLFDPNINEIVVSPSIPLSVQQETLLHEIQHGCFYLVNCSVENPDEEQYLTIATPILLTTLKDPINQEVFDFIFKD